MRSLGVIAEHASGRYADYLSALADYNQQIDQSLGQNVLANYAKFSLADLGVLGLTPDKLADPSKYSVSDAVRIHNGNVESVRKELAKLFTADPNDPNKKMPSQILSWNHERDADYIKNILGAYQYDVFSRGTYLDSNLLQAMQTVQEEVDAWSKQMSALADSIDQYTHAVNSGAIRSTGNSVDLWLSEDSYMNGRDVEHYLVPGSAVFDPKTSRQMTAEEYANTYLKKLPDFHEIKAQSDKIAELIKFNLSLDVAPLFNAYLRNAEYL